jgi:hypothetical protein
MNMAYLWWGKKKKNRRERKAIGGAKREVATANATTSTATTFLLPPSLLPKCNAKASPLLLGSVAVRNGLSSLTGLTNQAASWAS